MKLKRILRTSFAVFRQTLCLGACLFAVLSCESDECPNRSSAEDDVYISLRINVPGDAGTRTRALSVADESAIDNLQVLVFNAVDQFQYKAELGTPDAVSDGKVYVRLKKSVRGESYYLVLLANADEVNPSGNPTQTEVLEQCTFAATTGGNPGFPHSEGTTLPMWGESIPQVIDSDTNFGTISFYRAVARVDIGVNFQKDSGDGTVPDDNPVADGSKRFRLTSARVYNSLDKGYVAPLLGYGTISIPGTASVYTPDNYVDYSVNGWKQTDHEIYLPEVKNHTFDGSKKSLQERCCIIVGGLYTDTDDNFDNVSETYYRIDFLGDGKTDDTLLDIFRNHRYVFNITSVYGPGYENPEEALANRPVNLSVNVEHWDHGLNITDYNGQDNFQCSTKDVPLGYAKDSYRKVAVKSNVAVSEWEFENKGDWQDVLDVELPTDATTDIGYITFTAKGHGPIAVQVRIKINNLSITFNVTQSDGAYLSPDGVILYGWEQTNNGDETGVSGEQQSDVNTEPGSVLITSRDEGESGTVTTEPVRVGE
jgi:hypothetical protein